MGEGTRRVRGLQVEVSAGDQDKIDGVWRCSIFND
jgi:hypothetical protein